MSISLKSNISSSNVQRRLAQSAARLSTSFERLSSGMRINKAADDAAGLAIADGLKTDSRVFNQGVRNLNDGISLLNVADSAVDSLSNIVIRIRELSEQSANGTLSNTQRQALDEEAQALVSEFSRIAATTSVNNLNLLDGSLTSLSLQGGYGEEAAITEDLLLQGKSDASFSAPTSFATSSGPRDIILKDFNGDGELDFATADAGGNTISIALGVGDGTFGAATSFNVGTSPYALSTGDYDKDGNLDIVTADSGGNSFSIVLGNGDGSFSSATSFSVQNNPQGIAVGDLDQDGSLDIIVANQGSGTLTYAIGDGSGDFGNFDSSTSPGGTPTDLLLADFDGDNVLDYAVVNGGAQITTGIGVGLGNPGFGSPTVHTVSGTGGATADGIAAADVNNDGNIDLISGSSEGAVGILLGNGDGTFLAASTFATGGTPTAVAVTDFDGDGKLDIVTANSAQGTISVLSGNNDGTFTLTATQSAGTTPLAVAIGDLNLDGAPDINVANNSTNKVSVITTDNSTSLDITVLPSFSLATQTQAKAAMTILDSKLEQLGLQKGQIGAFQSRVNSAVNALQISSVNVNTAESRIRDVDVANETARLLKQNILQQSASSILAQANQLPALVLSLLETG